jgi:polyisoprenoid-binding protein YceI
MKNAILIFSIVTTGMMIQSCKSAPESDEAQVGEAGVVAEQSDAVSMPLNLQNSQIEWVGTKITSYHNGIIQLKSGDLLVKANELTGGSFVFDMSTILVTDDDMDEAGRAKLTGHLKSEDFFAVDTYPEAKFEITSIQPFSKELVKEDVGSYKEINEYKIAEPTHSISGNLTIRGITKGITFPALVSVNESGVTAKAKFNFNRLDWDVKYAGMKDDAINEMVHMGISLSTK